MSKKTYGKRPLGSSSLRILLEITLVIVAISPLNAVATKSSQELANVGAPPAIVKSIPTQTQKDGNTGLKTIHISITPNGLSYEKQPFDFSEIKEIIRSERAAYTQLNPAPNTPYWAINKAINLIRETESSFILGTTPNNANN